MANKYWGVSSGGSSSGTWNASIVTNWFDDLARTVRSTTAPTSSDNVFFDGSSDAGTGFTVTIANGAVCNDITVSSLDQAMILAGSGTWTVNGSLSFPATNLTYTATGAVTFSATITGKTITTNGVSMATCLATFNGIGGEWTLGSAWIIGGGSLALTLINGTFITNNFNVTGGFLSSTSTNVRTLTLGSSTLSFNRTVSTIQLNSTNLTFNAGTSTFQLTGSSAVIDITGGVTFNNVSFTNTGTGTVTISGANTFNDLSITSLAATGIKNINVSANQTINGTLTLGAANTAIRRILVRSDTVGTARTLTVATMATLADVDFRDITIAGTASPVSGTRLGNCGGNSGITFDAGKTVYRVVTGNWSATQWSLSSGGSVDVNNFPLAQDTAIFDTGTVTGTHTIDAGWNIGTLTMSSLNVAVTLATGTTTPTVYGNVTLDSDVTLTGTGAISFSGASTQNITSAGRTFTQPLIINKPTSTSVTLADNTITSAAFTLTQGTLDLNTDKTLTCLTFSSNNTNTRSIAFGTSGKVVVTGNNGLVLTFGTATNFSYTGTSNFDFTYSGGVGSRRIDTPRPSLGGTEANAFNINISAGTDSITYGFGDQNFKNYNFTGFSGSATLNVNLYGNLTLSTGMTVTATTGILTLLASTGTQTITSNGKTIDNPITKSAAGTLQLVDNLTQGSTRTFTLTNGTLDVNENILSVGSFSSSNSNTRTIDTGVSGEITVTGSGATAWNTGTRTNLTLSGNGRINMTSASAKTFAGGGATFPYTLNQGGSGDLTITGANTFANITNTVQPCTVIFPSSTITNLSQFDLNGTASNLVSIRSSTNGVQATINML